LAIVLFGCYSRQPINYCWNGVLRQMIPKLRHRIDSFPARWTASDNNTLTALRDRWRLVNEVTEVVSLDFLDRVCRMLGSQLATE